MALELTNGEDESFAGLFGGLFFVQAAFHNQVFEAADEIPVPLIFIFDGFEFIASSR